MNILKTCRHCGTTDQRGQWWSLKNYYGLSGWFCFRCNDLVEHRSFHNDPIGQPVNPSGYAQVIEKYRSNY